MSFHRVYLDTNILIAFLGEDSDHQLAMALSEVIEAVAARDMQPYVTSELALAEMLVRPMRAGVDLFSIDNVLTTSAWLEVVPVSRSVLWGAANLRSQHKNLKLPDAIHIATSLAKRCSHLLTADNGLHGKYQIKHNENIGVVVDTIRPDLRTLESLIDWQRP